MILFPEKVEHHTAYFPYINPGNLLGKDKRYWILAIQAIAKFHHYIKTEKITFLIQDTPYLKSLENTLNYAAELNIELPMMQLEQLRKDYILVEKNLQVIHGDFLAQNIMVMDEKIKIIDWEDMELGFPEHDVGRLLGDLNCIEPRWNKKYYPLEWHNSLAEEYLKHRLLLDSTYDIDTGRKMIHLGEMWNYLGPIEMSLMRKDLKSEWFLANLKAFENS